MVPFKGPSICRNGSLDGFGSCEAANAIYVDRRNFEMGAKYPYITV